MKRGRKSGGGCFFRLFVLVLVTALLAGGTGWYLLGQPYQGFDQEVFLDFEKGTSSSGMADTLASAGVIRGAWLFKMLRVLRPNARLQAGEYRFHEPASVGTVFDRIVRGDVFYYEVTVPEGSNIFDVAKRLDQLGFIPGKEFLKIARQPTLIHDLSPDAPSLEGYLFPSTYRLTRRTTAAQVAKMMTDQFRRRWAEIRSEQIPLEQISAEQMSMNRLVTLASVIEKETALSTDRTKVASVYANRLKQGMPLDADPTTIYAALLEDRYAGVIHKSDLANPSPYNTYKHAGLPPGPIANPGLASLRAALHPAETGYLYFVARGDGQGGSNFSTTLAEHQRHVREYRDAQK